MLLFYLWRSSLWRSIDAEKLRFFLGWTPASRLSHQHPLWRRIPWAKALLSPSGARGVLGWLRYRIELYDGLAG